MTHFAMPATNSLLVGVGATAVSVGTATSASAAAYTVAMPNLAFGIAFSSSIGTSAGSMPTGALAGSDGVAYGGNLQVVTTFGGGFGDTTGAGSYATAHSTTLASTASFGPLSSFGLGTNLLG